MDTRDRLSFSPPVAEFLIFLICSKKIFIYDNSKTPWHNSNKNLPIRPSNQNEDKNGTMCDYCFTDLKV